MSEKNRLAALRQFKNGMPEETKRKLSESHKGLLKGDKNPNWLGDNVTYGALHGWLRNNFGKADICENEMCKGKSKKYEWSLIHGKEYERKRENFFKLCVSCHKKYDITEETKNKIRNTLLGRPSPVKGIKYTEEQKSKLNMGGLIMFKKGYIPWNKGKKCPSISKSLKGKVPWNKGLKTISKIKTVDN